MRRSIIDTFNNIIYVIFIIATIISIFIVYKNIDNKFAIGFVIGYAIFAVVFLFYVILGIILNVTKLKWVGIRKRMIRFIKIFVILGILNYIFDYVFKSKKIDFLNMLSVSFGLALGSSFFDLVFFRERKLK
jgi:hypothetical protein